MAYNREELKDILDAKDQQFAERKLRVLRHAQQIGDTVSELQADPKWEKYSRPISEWLHVAKSRVETVEKKLAGDVLQPDEYVRLKVQQARAQGEFAAFTAVMKLAKDLISGGNQAREEIEKMEPK